MINKKDQKEMEDPTNSSNLIGKGTVLKGNLETFGNIRIEGKVVGDIVTKSKIALGHSSEIKGNILAQNAEVAGHVEGKIEISEVLLLKSTANIEGEIITNKLIVESGANFNGTCKMGVTSKEITVSEYKGEGKSLKSNA